MTTELAAENGHERSPFWMQKCVIGAWVLV